MRPVIAAEVFGAEPVDGVDTGRGALVLGVEVAGCDDVGAGCDETGAGVRANAAAHEATSRSFIAT